MLLAPARVKGVKKPPTLISCHAYVSWLAWNPECGVDHKHGTVSACQSEGCEEAPDSDQLSCICFLASMES